MAILLGILSALGWGSAYFIARWSTQAVGSVRTVFYTHLVGFILLSVYLLFFGNLQSVLKTVPNNIWLWLILAIMCATFGSLANYRAIQIGILSIVVPINSSYAMLVVILSVLTGETLSTMQIIAIIAVSGGVVLTSINGLNTHQFNPWPGTVWAIAGMILFGVSIWLFGWKVVPHFGGIIPIWFNRLISVALLSSVSLISRQRLKLTIPNKQAWLFVIAVGVLEITATALNFIGLGLGYVSVVSTLGSLYSAVTVLLAFFILGERLRWWQWIGIIIILIGIGLLS